MEYVAFYLIEFSDGGNLEGGLWCQGTKEDCEMVADRIPAIMYKGPRPNPKTCVFVMSIDKVPEDFKVALGINSVL